MRFIPEVVEDVEVIVEAAKDGSNKKNYFIDGIYIQADQPNRNSRIYPMDVIKPEVERYNEQFIKTNRALGELGHPESSHINLDKASHLIVGLKQEGKNFIGRSKLLDTPMGKIAKNFVDEGVKLGVSTRGFGDLTEEDVNGIAQVAPGFVLSTVDIVHDPSAPEAFVNNVMEGREWILKEGVLTEVKYDQIRKEVKKLTKTQLDEGALLKLFTKYIKSL